jgi:hypothetical protein
MVSATHTNITPAKLEEFEATFKHFDKDDTNVRPLKMMKLTKDPFYTGNAFGFGEFGYRLRRKLSLPVLGQAERVG